MTPSSLRFRSWPITATRSIEPMLKRMGLKISADKIDGTSSASTGGTASSSSGGCLSDALVSVGPAGRGGTGSFISKDGLILTNWHVAYNAVREASLNNKDGIDYVENGFVAQSRSDEIPGPKYEVWITKSCVDVSDQIVAVLETEPDDPLKRSNLVRDKMQEIAKTAQQERAAAVKQAAEDGNDSDDSIRCDVQEMLPNESYVLFTYERLRDVRIVYVPPKSLGNFGGDVDNFEWPRHTADFTLLRAYDVDNKPYDSSNAFIQVQKDGAQVDDMVFLLGFPGHTMRYAPSCRLRYSDDVAVPKMIRDFARKLQLIRQHEEMANFDPEVTLKLGGSKKSLSNEYKRSQGKLVMMRKLQLIPERQAEEKALCEKISDEKGPKSALDKLEKIYNQLREMEVTSSTLDQWRGIYFGSALLAAGHAVHEYLAVEAQKQDSDRETSYRDRNLPFLVRRLAKRISDMHNSHEAELVNDALQTLKVTSSKFSSSQNNVEDETDLYEQIKKILNIDDTGTDNCQISDTMVCNSKLCQFTDEESFLAALKDSSSPSSDGTESLLLSDPFVQCAKVLYNHYRADRDQTKALLSDRNVLLAELLEYQRQSSTSSEEVFYPDCNGSLRISAGHVEGYKAADAVQHTPITTLAGVFDKAAEARLQQQQQQSNDSTSDTDGQPKKAYHHYNIPQRLYEMLSAAADSASKDDNIANVPVCISYSTDTVGGNSGSPVMNANGELVGINFDRQRQGLMNEFKWSHDYSRSIGVDVRYILWLIGKYDNAPYLVEEMLNEK